MKDNMNYVFNVGDMDTKQPTVRQRWCRTSQMLVDVHQWSSHRIEVGRWRVHQMIIKTEMSKTGFGP